MTDELKTSAETNVETYSLETFLASKPDIALFDELRRRLASRDRSTIIRVTVEIVKDSRIA